VRVVRPSFRDPRLRLSLVVGGVQVIGQVGLGFELSIAQLLAPIAACALVELTLTAWRRRLLAWPASAVLTGNSTALLLRVPGTRHGDWWATRGIAWFVLAALLGLGAKYVVQTRGRHLYNPSNLGLVSVLLLAGWPWVAPMFLWWGPFSGWLAAVYLLVVVGGAWVLRPLGLLPMALIYLGAFAALTAVEAAGGTCFVASWHSGPVCGLDLWLNLALSPEVLVFAFLMIPDPRTVPETERGRAGFGLAVAALGAGLVALERSEYGVKVAVLAALTVLTPFAPLFDARPVPRRAWALLAAAGAAAAAVASATLALAYDEPVIEADLPPAPGCHAAPGAPVQLPPGSPCAGGP
jgi:hypothetical protein